MAKNRTGIETSAKILQAARREFLEKGFEKAKMEDIAARAGFNKVMLYYHFDSKEKLLRELIGGMLSEAKGKIGETFRNVGNLKSVDPELLVKKLKGIIGGNNEIIRLIASEVLKGNFPLGEVLDTLTGLYVTVIEAARKGGAKVDEPEKAYVRMFFFQTIPLILFNIYSREVAESYHLSPRRIEEIFAEKFRDTFFQTFFRDGKKTKERNR